MKSLKVILAALSAVTLAAGCNKDETNPQEYNLKPYQEARVQGNAHVVFVEEDAQHEEHSVHIVSGQEHADKVGVASMNGVLIIKVDDDVEMSDGVVIEVTSNDLTKASLEADSEAEFFGRHEFDELTIDARGNSRLTVTDLRVERLTVTTAGGAEVYLSTYIDEDKDDFVFVESSAVKVNENTILVDDDYIVMGDSVSLSDGKWIVYGENLRYHYCINETNMETKGNSEIYATGAPSLELDILLVGTSEAEVMVLKEISGEAKGNAMLEYVDVDDVNTASFSLIGSAQLMLLP